MGIDNLTLANSGQSIFNIKPRIVDLANADVISTAWLISNNDTIADSGATATGIVEKVIGAGLEAIVRTNAVGTVTSVTTTANGIGYTTPPNIMIQSANNNSGLTALDITARNFMANVVVGTVSAAVGNGYAFGVTDGVIYQKGYFIPVDPQVIIVSKYDQLPNAVSVGFETKEDIITADIDTDLRDNATGEPNEPLRIVTGKQ